MGTEVIRACKELNIANVCLTGGEPFIQPEAGLRHIVEELLGQDINVEAFSNGQVKYPAWAFEKVQFIMDWKLPGSGNEATDLTRQNIRHLKSTDAIKFVIKDHNDFNVATKVWERWEAHTLAQWWAGVVWEAEIQEAQLVSMIQDEQLPWNLNVQTHKYLWSADKRGV